MKFLKNLFSKVLAKFGYFRFENVKELSDMTDKKIEECEALISALVLMEDRDIESNRVVTALVMATGQEEFVIKKEFSKQIVDGDYCTKYSIDDEENLVLTVVIGGQDDNDEPEDVDAYQG